MKRLLFAFVFIICSVSARAELIAVDHPDPGVFQKKWTWTKYYQGQKSKALIVFIPGGEGQFNFDPMKKTDVTFHFSNTLKNLTKNIPGVSLGQFDLVMFDSPYPIQVMGGRAYPQSYRPGERASLDHAQRIQSVIEYYKNKTGLPIIILGHSNGALSISFYYGHTIEQKDKFKILPNLIVLSGARYEERLPKSIKTPVVFIHHKNDKCSGTLFEDTKNYYNELIKENPNRAKLIEIESGTDEGIRPCDGNSHHMMYQADDEYVSKLSQTLLKFLP